MFNGILWSAAEIETLIGMANAGSSQGDMSRRLQGRSEEAITSKINKLRRQGFIDRRPRAIAKAGEGASNKARRIRLDGLFRRAVRLGATNDWLAEHFSIKPATVQAWKARLDLKGCGGTLLAVEGNITERRCSRCRKQFEARDFLFRCDACRSSKDQPRDTSDAHLTGVTLRG